MTLKYPSPSSGVSAGENLVNFINNASSCVKTVLSKPGCFKRNTNHRRFLQKQLRQNVQDNIKTLKNETSSLSRNIVKSTKDATATGTNDHRPSSLVAKSDDKRIIDLKDARPSNNKAWSYRQKTIRKKRRYTPIRASPTTTMLQPPAPLLIPSPTANFPPESLFQEQEQFLFNASNTTTPVDFDIRQPFANFYNPADRSPTEASYFPTQQTTGIDLMPTATTLQSLLPSRKISAFSYAAAAVTTRSNEEEFGYSDFLSGEDLMRSLEFGDLFIPDNQSDISSCNSESSSDILQNELSFRSFVESERQIQYLAQLEAIEACYEEREKSLLMQFY